MKDLIIDSKRDTLQITCKSGSIEMSGNSIVPNAISFFQPVQNWVDEYIRDPAPATEITLKFNYVDSATVSVVFEILKKFTQIPDYSDKISVNWHYEFDDPELLEVGEIMEGRLKLNFNFVEFNEDY